MRVTEAPQPLVRGPRVWPLSVKAYHEFDRSKLRAYASAGVPESWLVLGPEKQIEVYRQRQGEEYAEHTIHGPGGSLTSTTMSGFTVALDSLFAA